MGNIASKIAHLLEQSNTVTFATAQGDNGTRYIQIMCPDGSGLSGVLDDVGNLQVRYCGEQQATNDKGMLRIEEIFVEANILDEDGNPVE